jgi:hypothetical protein
MEVTSFIGLFLSNGGGNVFYKTWLLGRGSGADAEVNSWAAELW